MHIRDARAFLLAGKLNPYILQSDCYVAEMDLRLPTPSSPGRRYQMEAHFRPKVFTRIKQQLRKSFDLDLDRYSDLHPLMIISAITQRILMQDHSISMDEYLWDIAARHRIDLTGLESLEEQVQLLHSLPVDPLYRQIKHISQRPDVMRAFTQKSIDYYLKADIHALYLLTKRSMHELRRPVIYDRNYRMVKRIQMYDHTKSHFIAVGAGHLSGRYGIISLLRKEGWEVRPVPLDTSGN